MKKKNEKKKEKKTQLVKGTINFKNKTKTNKKKRVAGKTSLK